MNYRHLQRNIFYLYIHLVEKEDDYDYNEDDKKSGWKYWDMEPVTESYDNHKSSEFREKPRMYLDTVSSNMAENEVSDINSILGGKE